MKVSVQYAAEHFKELVSAVHNGGDVEIECVGQPALCLELKAKPPYRSLADAPWEDEEISDDENRVAAEARARGYVASPNSHEKLLRDLGLTLEDFDRMAREPLEADVPVANRG